MVLWDQLRISTSFSTPEFTVNFEMSDLAQDSGGLCLWPQIHPVAWSPNLTLWVFLKHDSLKTVNELAYKILLMVGRYVDVSVLTRSVCTRAYTVLTRCLCHN